MVYELTVLLKPDLEEKALSKEVKGVEEILIKAGGEISRKLEPLKKTLAYKIKKYSEAYYLYLEANLQPEAVLGVDQKLKLQENILRHLIVKASEKKEAPKAKSRRKEA